MLNKKFIIITVILIINLSSANVLLDTVSGIVGRGNFTHWSLGYRGHIILVLTTLEGDADLYTTDKNHKPTYEPDLYDLHSATCGVDIVEIPKSFRRPVGIGIYGHPSYENSTYILEVYYDREQSQSEVFNSLENDLTVQDNVILDNTNEDEHRDDVSFNGIKKYRIKGKLLAGMWSLLEIFDLLFTF